MVDKFSGWPKLAKMGKSTDSMKVMQCLCSWFSDVGIPKILVADGGPQFKSRLFHQWCLIWNITLHHSSPYHPASNGVAEAAVKSLKYLVAKITENGNLNTDAFCMGLIELRNMPREHGKSPAEILFGRPIRGMVPMHETSFVTNGFNDKDYEKR